MATLRNIGVPCILTMTDEEARALIDAVHTRRDRTPTKKKPSGRKPGKNEHMKALVRRNGIDAAKEMLEDMIMKVKKGGVK